MAIVVAYVVLSKKLKASDTMQIKQLREGTQEKSFSFEYNNIEKEDFFS